MVNRQCKCSSLGPGGPQPYPLTKPRHSIFLCTFILASAKLTFLSFRHLFTDSIHFFFDLPAGRFPTHSPLYIRLKTDYQSSFPHDQTIATYFHLLLSFTHFFTPHNSLICSFLILSILPVSYTHLRAHETPEHLVCRL